MMKMRKPKKMMEQVKLILKKRGEKAFEIAKQSILQEKIKNKLVYEALQYFMKECWYDVQHPALLSLTCEAVGGNPEVTMKIGAAIVLLAGAADIHDDIIDKSKTKNSKPTVLGKFGMTVTLLTGDALLFKGLMLLHEACKSFQEERKEKIIQIIKEAFFEIGSAEVKEAALRHKKFDLTPQEYYSVIRMKAALAEATSKIGTILGGGTKKEIDILSHFGRTLGILMTVRDDFIDLFEPYEITNRTKNECLPLPILYAFQNSSKKEQIIHLLKKEEITEIECQKIVNLAMDCPEVQRLKNRMYNLVEREKHKLNSIKLNVSAIKDIKLMLEATLEDL